MGARIEFFPVDNGDMTLLTLNGGRRILIDINIRKAADDENDSTTIDVASLLRSRLDRDEDGRLYVDVFLLTHPDKDHCSGLERHFHLGQPDEWNESEDKILIKEMWSSPIIFRRQKEVEGGLCPDADAWWKEARRRARLYKSATRKEIIGSGNLIQILGEDKDNKTDDLTEILVKTNTEIVKICGVEEGDFRAWLLAPQLVCDDELEQLTGKNHSSTVIRFAIHADGMDGAGLFLTGGDAQVENWERVWKRNSDHPDRLTYNVLQAPHHCSWRSLSYDSWSDKGDSVKVSQDAREALAQAAEKSFIVASCKEIKDDKDPPCIRAKQEYIDILSARSGEFLCTASECENDVLTLEIDRNGPSRPSKKNKGGLLSGLAAAMPRKVEKDGGGRYA
ncbi:metallohydrolase [Cellvibrio sp. KY-YJ-3]|uniref:metallohydrolase n=1 Tax=Cellvibrio sp. KY-YJ-3 TaxID=454662 RepID=UPI001248094A|nr:metallohydrolase [Cellvibrio sp. KY-YJ-3]QEY13280.1 metallohydrolase [Cellvibrio sp. KY-YJ-3]